MRWSEGDAGARPLLSLQERVQTDRAVLADAQRDRPALVGAQEGAVLGGGQRVEVALFARRRAVAGGEDGGAGDGGEEGGGGGFGAAVVRGDQHVGGECGGIAEQRFEGGMLDVAGKEDRAPAAGELQDLAGVVGGERLCAGRRPEDLEGGGVVERDCLTRGDLSQGDVAR